MQTTDEYVFQSLRLSTVEVLDNLGFTVASDDSLEMVTDLLRRFMTKVIENAKMYAEHASRTSLVANDVGLAFRRLNFNSVEMAEYLSQCGNVGAGKPLPRFPANRPNVRPLFHPQPSEKELETRPDHIPPHLMASHPEWTKEGADYLAVMKPSTSADKKGIIPDFPSFTGSSARSLRLMKTEKPRVPVIPTHKDDSSATGIRSSANISSQKLVDQQELLKDLAKKRPKPSHYLSKSHSQSPTPASPHFKSRVGVGGRDSPAFSMSTERIKNKNKLTHQASGSFDDRGSPMPILSDEGRSLEQFDIPPTPKMSDSENHNEHSLDGRTPTPLPLNPVEDPVNADLIKKLKDDAEKERMRKLEKEREKEEKQRKKEENRERKREQQKKKEEKKKEQERLKAEKEKEKERKKKDREREMLKLEEARLAERRKLTQEAVAKIAAEEAAKRARLLIEEEKKPEIKEEPPIKLLITNPLDGNSASSAFSPPSQPCLPDLPTPPKLPLPDGLYAADENSNTTPCVDESAMSSTGPTTFPLNMSLDSLTSEESPSKLKKEKKKKKDKDRDRSLSPHKHKEKKKDKERKKKKKKDRELHEKEREHHHQDKERRKNNEDHVEVKEEPKEKIMLKIRIGDGTPNRLESSPRASSSFVSPPHNESPMKFKLKPMTPECKVEDKVVPPLRLGGMVLSFGKDAKQNNEEKKNKVVTKAELKAHPSGDSEFSSRSAKEEKKRKKEERRQKEEEEKRRAEETMKKRREEEERRKEEDRKREEQRIREEEDRKREELRREEEKMKEEERRKEEKRKREEEKKEREREKEREEKKKKKHSNAPVHIEIDTKKKKKDKPGREKEGKREKKEKIPCSSSVIKDDPSDDRNSNDDDEVWICPACNVAWTEGATMVGCDMCDNWFHWHCVGLQVAPDEHVPWFCEKCILKRKRSSKGSSGPPNKKKRFK